MKNWGDVGFPEAWGLARWGGAVYLWGGASAAFEVSLVGNSVTTTPIPNTPSVNGGYPSAAAAPSTL